jgi:predicted NAD/FAD-binding protein
MSQSRLRIAIVGSGVSGLVAAHLLSPRHEVTVFEAGEHFGGHANTVDVVVDGNPCSVDTGFIVYNERTYPGFCRLLDRLGVATEPSDMSFSVSAGAAGLEYATHSMDGLFARRASLVDVGFYAMIREILRFNRESRELIAGAPEAESDLSLGEYLQSRRYGRRFIDHYIVPMGAAIWSAEPRRLLDFPAASFVRFFDNHGLLDHRESVAWRTVSGGSRSYVRALLVATPARFIARCPVFAVRRHADCVELLLPDAARLRFDHVIMACHSNQALSLLDDASVEETRVLGSIRYRPNDVVLHTDASVMPARRRAWASWNYRVDPERAADVQVTYWMNRLQNLDTPRPLFVSLNSDDRIDQRSVLRRFRYEHPVYDADTLAAQHDRARIDGNARTHFCGAYWGHGFHEDGVASARAVCSRFGVEL